ncbi:hypothetical protein H0H87_005229 [Tephrocybe sp. NHM501043]|nr:hypothetical protein H0H87_005229 [Tephrocybe sp. NHM501043]
MAYYYPAQTREPRMNNNGSVHLSQVPDGGQRSLGSDWSGSAHTYPAHTTEGQDDPKKREKLQQYTYIPSTSTFSPHQRPPSVIPSFTPYISSYGPQPPHPTQATVQPPHSYPAGYTPHIIPAPPIPPIPPSQYHGPSAPGSLGDPAPPVLYLSVDPFRGHKKTKEAKTSLPMAYDDYKEYPPSEVPDYVVYPYAHRRTVILALLIDFLNSMFGFFFDSLPRQIYLLFLLYLPSFYFSRVARIFEEAEMTMPEIENMALQVMGSLTIQELQWSSPASANLKATWEGFIDSLLREWKTLNIVSVLLLS